MSVSMDFQHPNTDWLTREWAQHWSKKFKLDYFRFGPSCLFQKNELTKYLPSLKRAWSVRITASSVRGPCKWIKSSISFDWALCVAVTVRVGENIFGLFALSMSAGTRLVREPLFMWISAKEDLFLSGLKFRNSWFILPFVLPATCWGKGWGIDVFRGEIIGNEFISCAKLSVYACRGCEKSEIFFL